MVSHEKFIISSSDSAEISKLFVDLLFTLQNSMIMDNTCNYGLLSLPIDRLILNMKNQGNISEIAGIFAFVRILHLFEFEFVHAKREMMMWYLVW